jgi:hypothetical protein
MTPTKVTLGCYRYELDKPVKKVVSVFPEREEVTYVALQTCGRTPVSVFDLLHRGHEAPSVNVMVFKAEGGYDLMTFSKAIELLGLEESAL